MGKWRQSTKVLSITECKIKLNKKGIKYSDEEIELIRNVLYKLAEVCHKIINDKKSKMKKLAIEKFKDNEDNFFKMFHKAIIDDESLFDQTTTIKGYFNTDMIIGDVYFRFEIKTDRTHFSTDYYRYDYNFKEGNVNNVDDLDSIFEDIEMFSIFGDDVINQNYI